MCGQFILSVSTPLCVERNFLIAANLTRMFFCSETKLRLYGGARALQVRGIIVAGRENSRFGCQNALVLAMLRAAASGIKPLAATRTDG